MPPQIYREGVRELSDSSVLQRLEIYSQGDLQLIAQDDKLRLDLIDRPHKAKVDSLKVERDRHAEPEGTRAEDSVETNRG